jgi:transcriptional regulator with XRE-family HTH domain
MSRITGPNPLDKAIGARLRAYRHAAGLSQSQIGFKLGVTFQQIQKYENGKNRLSGSRLITAATVLKVSPSDLLGGNGDDRGLANEDFIAMKDRGVMNMVMAMSQLTTLERRIVVNAMTAVIQLVAARVAARRR